jgi:hypothetical protein
MGKNENISKLVYLRQNAEKLLNSKQSNANSEYSEKDTLKLIQELKVYQT